MHCAAAFKKRITNYFSAANADVTGELWFFGGEDDILGIVDPVISTVAAYQKLRASFAVIGEVREIISGFGSTPIDELAFGRFNGFFDFSG